MEPNVQEDLLNNIFTHKVLKLLFKVIKLNVFSILQQEEQFFIIVPLLVQMLEYDLENPNISIQLRNSRKSRFKKKKAQSQEGKGVLGGMTSIVSGAVGGLKDATNLMGKFLIDDKEEDQEGQV